MTSRPSSRSPVQFYLAFDKEQILIDGLPGYKPREVSSHGASSEPKTLLDVKSAKSAELTRQSDFHK